MTETDTPKALLIVAVQDLHDGAETLGGALLELARAMTSSLSYETAVGLADGLNQTDAARELTRLRGEAADADARLAEILAALLQATS